MKKLENIIFLNEKIFKTDKIIFLKKLCGYFSIFVSDVSKNENDVFYEQQKNILIYDTMFDDNENLIFITYAVRKLYEFKTLTENQFLNEKLISQKQKTNKNLG